MRFFSSQKNDTNTFPGQSLVSLKQLETIVSDSFLKPQLIFKHSTRCSISRFVLDSFISNYSFDSNDFGTWYLDLLTYRDISNTIATEFDVIHQSPQLIVIRNGKVIIHASHDNILNADLKSILN